MNWFGTVTLRIGASISCPLDSERCSRLSHDFQVTQTAATPVAPEVEKEIRLKLQSQLDLIVNKFLETHK